MKLHTWLSETGRTVAWLVDETGLSHSYLSRLLERDGEPAEKSPSMETCALIAQATRGAVTANDFMPQTSRRRPLKKREHRACIAA